MFGFGLKSNLSRALDSLTMRSGMPSASNSALNLYPWISFNFVKDDSDISYSSQFWLCSWFLGLAVCFSSDF